MSVISILDRIASTLDEAFRDSEDDFEIQVTGRMNFNPTQVSVDMYPGDRVRDPETAAFGDVDGGLIFTIRARVSTADFEAGQDILLRMMDDNDPISVGGILFADPTLDGFVLDSTIEGPSGYTRYPDPSNAGAYLGCQWRFTVMPGDS